MAASVMGKVMRAVRVHEVGGPGQLTYETDVPSPSPPGPGDVLGTSLTSAFVCLTQRHDKCFSSLLSFSYLLLFSFLSVRNVFSGINYIDTYHRNGSYPVSLPHILGREVSFAFLAAYLCLNLFFPFHRPQVLWNKSAKTSTPFVLAIEVCVCVKRENEKETISLKRILSVTYCLVLGSYCEYTCTSNILSFSLSLSFVLTSG
jgi:hypothetical protein